MKQLHGHPSIGNGIFYHDDVLKNDTMKQKYIVQSNSFNFIKMTYFHLSLLLIVFFLMFTGRVNGLQ